MNESRHVLRFKAGRETKCPPFFEDAEGFVGLMVWESENDLNRIF